MPEKIIIDTSVLIALEKLNLLSLLCNVYDEVWVPEAVKKEFGEIMLPCVIIKKSQSNLIQLLGKDLNLGKGEAEVISLAHENKTKVLIDDLKARKIAINLQIQVSGTVGFLVKAYQLNLITSAYENVHKLINMGFYVSDQLQSEIKQLEQK